MERCFRVLQSKFHIIALPSRLWKQAEMKTIMYCCVILHNMVAEEKRPVVEIEEGSAINTVVSDEIPRYTAQ